MHKIELQDFKAMNTDDYVIVDTRKPEVFADGFITGSLSVPFTPDFINLLSDLVSMARDMIIVADEADITEISKQLKGAGWTNLKGFVKGGFEGWKNAGNSIDMLIPIDADEFGMDYQFDEFYLVDLREKEDFDQSHVEDAENMALADIEALLTDLETSGSYYLYGQTGAQAITAASLLKRNGFQRVRPVMADYEAIRNSGIPVFAPKKKGNSTTGNSEK